MTLLVLAVKMDRKLVREFYFFVAAFAVCCYMYNVCWYHHEVVEVKSKAPNILALISKTIAEPWLTFYSQSVSMALAVIKGQHIRTLQN